MNVTPTIWDRLTQAIAGLIAVAMVAGVVVWYLPLFQQNQRMRSAILKLDHEIAKEEAEVRKAEVQIDAIQNDRKTVERLARERLGYAKPGEIVVRFNPPTQVEEPSKAPAELEEE